MVLLFCRAATRWTDPWTMWTSETGANWRKHSSSSTNALKTNKIDKFTDLHLRYFLSLFIHKRSQNKQNKSIYRSSLELFFIPDLSINALKQTKSINIQIFTYVIFYPYLSTNAHKTNKIDKYTDLHLHYVLFLFIAQLYFAKEYIYNKTTYNGK